MILTSVRKHTNTQRVPLSLDQQKVQWVVRDLYRVLGGLRAANVVNYPQSQLLALVYGLLI